MKDNTTTKPKKQKTAQAAASTMTSVVAPTKKPIPPVDITILPAPRRGEPGYLPPLAPAKKDKATKDAEWTGTRSKSGRPTFTKPKPKRIIRRKPGTKNPANYFTSATQDSIVKYQAEKNAKEKEQIYVKEVLPAFDSLVENLINVYGFKISYETKKDLKIECLEFLYSTVNKFDATKGSKAFSYFNVVAKNWLTIKSKQNAKRIKTYVSSDDKDNLSSSDLEQFEQYNVVPSYEDVLQKAEMAKYLKNLVVELEKKVKTENEKVTIMAINTIIENLDNIDILNKRAILLYIREITGLSSKQLSLVLASIKKHYKEIKRS